MLDKQSLIKILNEKIDHKIRTLQDAFDDLQSSLEDATKSSAGDKHETSRAMAQLEQEKLSKQLSNVNFQKNHLQQIDGNAKYDSAVLGSIVETQSGAFFLSISMGKVSVNNEEVFCISPSSPMGRVLLEKQVGDTTEFNGATIKIEKVY